MDAVTASTLDRFFSLSHDMLGIANLDGYFIKVNPAFEQTLGYTSAELTACPFLDFVHPDDRESTLAAAHGTAEGVAALDFMNRYRCKDGSYKWLSWTSVPSLEEGVTYAVARDVTEARQAEEALRQSEDRFAKAFQCSPAAMAITRLTDSWFIDANASFLRLLGYRRDELIGRTTADLHLIPGVTDRARLVDEIRAVGSVHNLELQFITAAGRPRTMLVAAEQISLGGVPCLLTVLDDVMAQGQPEAAVRESEQRLRTFIQAMPVGAVLFGPQGEFQMSNAAALEILGLTAEQLAGRTALDPGWKVVTAGGRAVPLEALPPFTVARTGEAVRDLTLGIARSSAAERVWVVGSALPLRGADGSVTGTIWTFTDITARKQAEEAQRASEQARQAAEELARVREERAREAEAMAVVGAALAGTLDLPTLYQVILEQSAKLLPGDYASVLVMADGWLIAAASRGEPARPPGLRLWPLDRAATGWRERAFGRPTIVVDTVQEPTWEDLPPWVGEHRVRSLLTTPIRIEGAVRGFFAVYSRSASAFTADHARLAGLFAERVGQAWLNARPHAAAQAARVRAEYESNLLQTLMDAIPDAIYFKDASSRFVRINMAEAELLGARDPQETVGKSDADYFSGELAQALVSKERQLLATGQPLINDLEDQSVQAGAPRWILTTKVPIVREGQITGLVGISRDITDLRAAEASRVQAETANQAKSAFLSRMSHELRTPLNAILGFGQLLELDAQGADQQAVAYILQAGRHLLTLINEVLEISRIEAGRLELSLEPVAVTEVVDEACGLLLPLIRERSIRVERPAGGHRACYVQADRQRFRQVLMNLLSNAVKYNVTGGTVQVFCSHPGPGRLRLSVQDTGPGIPVEKQGRLFTPFDRLGAEQTGVEGTGMGLALSKRLVEAMGGTLGVQSAAGEGSAFWVELERADPAPRACAEPARGAQGGAEQAPAQRTILYIEDNLASLELIEGVLAREPGITLLTAMQGSRGLDLARAQRPDLVLLDVHLPDMPSDEVLRRLQADAATRHIPVVVISADATHRQEERLTAAGARAYVTKPIDIRQLRATLASLVPPEAVLRPDSVNEHG